MFVDFHLVPSELDKRLSAFLLRSVIIYVYCIIVYNMYIQSVIEMRKLNLSHTNLIDSDILHRLHTTHFTSLLSVEKSIICQCRLCSVMLCLFLFTNFRVGITYPAIRWTVCHFFSIPNNHFCTNSIAEFFCYKNRFSKMITERKVEFVINATSLKKVWKNTLLHYSRR